MAIIQEDTRQQNQKHIRLQQAILERGHEIVRSKLYVGDYTLLHDQSVCVDTKKDILELVANISDRRISKSDVGKRVERISKEYDINHNLSRQIYHEIINTNKETITQKRLKSLLLKHHLDNLVGNQFLKVFEGYYGRYRMELIRARDNGIKLVILVGNDDGVECKEDLINWQNPRLKIMHKVNGKKVQKYPRAMTGEQLYKAIGTMKEKYSMLCYFCEKDEQGKELLKLLGVHEV